MHKCLMTGVVKEKRVGSGTTPFVAIDLRTREYDYQTRKQENKYRRVKIFGKSAEAAARLTPGTAIEVEANPTAGRPYLKRTAQVTEPQRQAIEKLIADGQIVASIDYLAERWDYVTTEREPAETAGNTHSHANADTDGDPEVQWNDNPAPPAHSKQSPAVHEEELDPFANG